MKKVAINFRLLVNCLVMLTLVFASLNWTAIQATAATRIDAKAAIMVDADTGQVIYQQNADAKLPVASISKLLTACVIEDEIAHHQLSWKQKVKVNDAIADVSNDPAYSAIGLQAGQSYTIQELFDAMLVKSADGAALALSMATGDSIKQFNKKMQKKARQIGVRDATIVNSVGLCNGDLKGLQQQGIDATAENTMSARSVAIISRYLLKHHPDVLAITKRPQEQFWIADGNVRTEDNSNQMLPGGEFSMPQVRIDGLKTGTSDVAGACFASTGIYRGHRFITVVLHANGTDYTDRFIQTQRLYQMIDQVPIKSVKLTPMQTQNQVTGGTKTKLTVGPKMVTVWQTTSKAKYKVRVNYDRKLTNSSGHVKAPVKRGQRLGSITVSGRGLKTLDNKPLTFPLRAQQTVQRGNFFQRLIH